MYNYSRSMYFKKSRRALMPREFKFRRRIFATIVWYLLLGAFTCLVTVITFNLCKSDPSKASLQEHLPAMLKARGDVNKLEAGNIDKSYRKNIDWHNYDQINKDKHRTGPAEQGKPANSSGIDKNLVDKIYSENGYNGALSDTISLHRALPDKRPEECLKKLYNTTLPDVSIIIPFNNEHLSVVLRTLWSIVERTPEQLVKEIILVDDFSDRDSTKKDLEDYVGKYFPKVKLIRLSTRSGLIVARQEGAKIAKGQVLVFMDAHCEVTHNWLPPLLDIISDDYKTCVCPLIDSIDCQTYEYYHVAGGRGAFNWHLDYQILFLFEKYRDHPAEPYEIPVMASGLFAISSKFFWELEGYDDELFIWGAEQLEISFKIWMCGGKLMNVPCSRVGHLDKNFATNHDHKTPYLCKNKRRVAETWMDDYKKQFYKRDLTCAKVDFGSISKQVALRNKLKCKSFQWYMDNVANDVLSRFPLDEPQNVGYGEIRNMGNTDYCVATTNDDIKIEKCSKDTSNQKIQYTWYGEIKKPDSAKCWDLTSITNDGKRNIFLFACHMAGGNQVWKHDEANKYIQSSLGECLEMNVNSTPNIYLTSCDPKNPGQKWTIENFNKEQHDKIGEALNKIFVKG